MISSLHQASEKKKSTDKDQEDDDKRQIREKSEDEPDEVRVAR